MFAQSVSLSIEQGVTRASGSAGVVAMNNSIASINKQCTVDGSSIIMQAAIAWDIVSKARQPNSAQAFENALTETVDNLLLSHRRHQVSDMLYGGVELAVINTGTASATQPLTLASTAPAIWYGSQNMLIDIYDVTLTTKRNASPLSLSSFSVDPSGASRTLTFGTSVTTTTGDVVVFSGTVASNAYSTANGLSYIAGLSGGTLFGLSQTSYPTFQAAQFAVGSTSLTMKLLDKATALPLNRGYMGKLVLLCSPITFSNLSQEETARVQLINGNATGTAKIGFNKVNILTSTGANVECRGSPWIKEGEAYLVPDDGSVKRIGSCDIQLGGPSDPYPTWRRIEGFTGYSIPSFSLSAMFTSEPWKITKLTGIVNS